MLLFRHFFVLHSEWDLLFGLWKRFIISQLGGKKRSMELLAAVVASLIIDKGIHCELLR